MVGVEHHEKKNVAIRPETFAVSARPMEPAEGSYTFEATDDSHISHGNVLRYTMRASEVAFHVDVLFRSFQLFENGQKLYLSVEKKNCIEV
jgi:putative spermidine/putrescine transport system ATP-binding protein